MGEASFSRLRGMFAFAIWNEAERRLVLVRDRLGIKPLYLHRRGDDVYLRVRVEDAVRASGDWTGASTWSASIFFCR